MILDEVIERYTSNAEYERTHGSLQGCLEFRQLAEWLKELKENKDVLDKIRAELHANAEMHDDGDYYLRDEWVDEIFDKYRGESDTDG